MFDPKESWPLKKSKREVNEQQIETFFEGWSKSWMTSTLSPSHLFLISFNVESLLKLKECYLIRFHLKQDHIRILSCITPERVVRCQMLVKEWKSIHKGMFPPWFKTFGGNLRKLATSEPILTLCPQYSKPNLELYYLGRLLQLVGYCHAGHIHKQNCIATPISFRFSL